MRKRLLCVAMMLAPSVMAGCNARGAAASTDAAETSAIGVPSAGQLDAFVSGAGRVRLGMTEEEVSNALGAPSRRQDAASPGASTDVAWDHVVGSRPGAALGRFVDGKLVSVEFVTTVLALPGVDPAVAASLTAAAIVQRSVANDLRMRDVEAVARTPGQRISWTIAIGNGNRPTVMTRWAWAVEPAGDYLIVEERDGFAGQPIVRKK